MKMGKYGCVPVNPCPVNPHTLGLPRPERICKFMQLLQRETNVVFCSNCGTEGTGNFCTKCGHPLKSAAIIADASDQKLRQNIIAKKLANALIKDAEPDFGAFLMLLA
jgi:hypothetical protein